jgi:hypothetical protein
MEALFMTVAASASVDASSNQLSIFNIIEEASAVQFPIATTNWTVCALLIKGPRDPDDPDLTLAITSTTQRQELFKAGFKALFQGKPRTRLNATLPPLILPGPGTLKISLKTARKELCSWTVLVTQLPQPTVQASPAGNSVSQPLSPMKRRAAKAKTKKRR